MFIRLRRFLKLGTSASVTITDMEAPIHVALVEDDEEIRANLTYRISESASLRLVGSYRDAETALAELPSRKTNVVLMDINLPGMNGVECVRSLNGAGDAAAAAC